MKVDIRKCPRMFSRGGYYFFWLPSINKYGKMIKICWLRWETTITWS